MWSNSSPRAAFKWCAQQNVYARVIFVSSFIRFSLLFIKKKKLIKTWTVWLHVLVCLQLAKKYLFPFPLLHFPLKSSVYRAHLAFNSFNFAIRKSCLFWYFFNSIRNSQTKKTCTISLHDWREIQDKNAAFESVIYVETLRFHKCISIDWKHSKLFLYRMLHIICDFSTIRLHLTFRFKMNVIDQCFLSTAKQRNIFSYFISNGFARP